MPVVYDVLVDGKPLAEVVAAVPDVGASAARPATIDLAGAEIELVSLVARETRLSGALDADRPGDDRHDRSTTSSSTARRASAC